MSFYSCFIFFPFNLIEREAVAAEKKQKVRERIEQKARERTERERRSRFSAQCSSNCDIGRLHRWIRLFLGYVVRDSLFYNLNGGERKQRPLA